MTIKENTLKYAVIILCSFLVLVSCHEDTPDDPDDPKNDNSANIVMAVSPDETYNSLDN